MPRAKRPSDSVAYFDRFSELLSSSGIHSFHAAPISIHWCDVSCAVARFCLTFWPASLCLKSISTENWAAVDDATSEFIGHGDRSTFLTPRGLRLTRRTLKPKRLKPKPRSMTFKLPHETIQFLTTNSTSPFSTRFVRLTSPLAKP